MNAGHSEVEAIKVAREKVCALGFGLYTLQAELIRRAILVWEARLG